jgi:hypothetical protein
MVVLHGFIVVSLDDADVETVAPILERAADLVQRIKPWPGHKKNLIGWPKQRENGEDTVVARGFIPAGSRSGPNKATSCIKQDYQWGRYAAQRG